MLKWLLPVTPVFGIPVLMTLANIFQGNALRLGAGIPASLLTQSLGVFAAAVMMHFVGYANITLGQTAPIKAFWLLGLGTIFGTAGSFSINWCLKSGIPIQWVLGSLSLMPVTGLILQYLLGLADIIPRKDISNIPFAVLAIPLLLAGTYCTVRALK